MKIRAVIFDIYTTILEVGPPPRNADALWLKLFEEMLGSAPPVSRTEFAIRTAQVIARQHAAARARGIQWPEILWRSVVLEAIPSLARLTAPKLEDFLFRQMQIGRTLALQDGAKAVVSVLRERGCLLGIASNSQAYTLQELGEHLVPAGLSLDLFDPDLCFWSFAHGFSKPDPHVFQMLTARLAARGIAPEETLMVGDRLDNDIEPARAFGWQTWLLTSSPASGEPGQGTFSEMLGWLRGA